MIDATVLQGLIDVDTDLMLSINSIHSAFFDVFMWRYTKVAIWIPFYVALVFFLFKNMKPKTMLWALVCVALTILICDQVTSHLIRPMVQRLRPANLDNPINELVHIVNGYRGGRYSFPSAHAANTFGLTFFLMYLFRNKLLTSVLVLWAFLNCYSRIYLGVHYPGDILAGILVGFIAASFSYWIFRRFCKENAAKHHAVLVQIPVVVWLLSVAFLCVYAAIKLA